MSLCPHYSLLSSVTHYSLLSMPLHSLPITHYSLQFCKRCFAALALVITLSALIPSTARAASYITIDNETGYILEGKNRDDKVPVANLTQVALALTLLDWIQLSKTSLDMIVEVPSNTLTQGSFNPLGLQPGDRLTLRDLLYLSLLTSDCEASTTIAFAVGQRLPNPQKLDPAGNFVSQMNALAAALEMKHTLFLNPSGLDMPPSSAQPYSSAADLARLTRYAYSKPGFSFYVAQSSRDVHVDRHGQSLTFHIQNTNKLLHVDDIDGVKTAMGQKSGEAVVLTSSRHPEVKRVGDTVYTTPRRVITVVLGSTDASAEALILLRRGWSLYDAWATAGRVLKPGTFL